MYTDSESDRDLLKVKYILSLRERSVDEITHVNFEFSKVALA